MMDPLVLILVGTSGFFMLLYPLLLSPLLLPLVPLWSWKWRCACCGEMRGLVIVVIVVLVGDVITAGGAAVVVVVFALAVVSEDRCRQCPDPPRLICA